MIKYDLIKNDPLLDIYRVEGRFFSSPDWPKDMTAYATVQRPSSIVRYPSPARRQQFPLNDFFSKTTWPIWIFGRKYSWQMGIHICSNEGAILGAKTDKSLKNILLMNH